MPKDIHVVGTDLKVGDVVRLRSGGPDMTVVGNIDGDIHVMWFVKDGDCFADICRAHMPRAALDMPDEV